MKITKAICALVIGLVAVFAAIEGNAAVQENYRVAEEVVRNYMPTHSITLLTGEELVQTKGPVQALPPSAVFWQ